MTLGEMGESDNSIITTAWCDCLGGYAVTNVRTKYGKCFAGHCPSVLP